MKKRYFQKARPHQSETYFLTNSNDKLINLYYGIYWFQWHNNQPVQSKWQNISKWDLTLLVHKLPCELKRGHQRKAFLDNILPYVFWIYLYLCWTWHILCADYQVIVLNSKYTVLMPISIEFKVFHRLSFCHNHESKFNE